MTLVPPSTAALREGNLSDKICVGQTCTAILSQIDEDWVDLSRSGTMDREHSLRSAIHAELPIATMETPWISIGRQCFLWHEPYTNGMYPVTCSPHVNSPSLRIHPGRGNHACNQKKCSWFSHDERSKSRASKAGHWRYY
jgi:hypothetical protein